MSYKLFLTYVNYVYIVWQSSLLFQKKDELGRDDRKRKGGQMFALKLSNEELEIRLKDFVKKERFLLHIILDHIKEVDRRKLYLERAYPSLFEYLVKELGYSNSAAMRRQEAARLMSELPELGQKIQNGLVNLTQIGELARALKQKRKLESGIENQNGAPLLTETEKSQLVSAIQGKSAQETQQIISKTLDLPIQTYDRQRLQQDESVRIEITLTKEQYAKLVNCKENATHSLQQKGEDLNWASVLNLLADNYLRKKKIMTVPFPKREPVNSAPASLSRNPSPVSHAKVFSAPNKNLRQKVLNRDKSCQYQDPLTQKVCGSTFALQVDHKLPRWAQRFEANSYFNKPENLQALCSYHNRHKYKKESHIH